MNGPRPWSLHVTARRSRRQWRLLAVVAAVVLLVGTVTTAVVMQHLAIERTGVRTALAGADPAASELVVTATRLSAELADVRRVADEAVGAVTHPAPVTGSVVAQTALHRLHDPEAGRVLTYLAHLEALEDHADLRRGTWPAAGTRADDADGAIPVAVPLAMADALDLEIGDRLTIETDTAVPVPRTAKVVGVFEIDEPGGRYWSADRLGGVGADLGYVVASGAGTATVPAFGPLAVGPTAFADHDVPVERLTLRYAPDFSVVGPADLGALLDRLGRAEDTVVAEVGELSRQADVTTGLADVVRGVVSTVTLTRASVLLVALLLLVLSGAALHQAARLLADSRTAEEGLMRARGASARQLLGLAGLEALVVATLTAVAAPVLARALLRTSVLSAATPTGADADPGVPAVAWVTAGVVGSVLGLVVLAPLVRRAGTFASGERARARPRRAAVARSGLDLVLVVTAVVTYGQLVTYRGSLTSQTGADTAALRIDPVLVAAPAIVLLAGALLCVRVVPVAARLAEHLGARGRGAIAPLAAWGVGRRPGHVRGVLLLVVLALAVGTFSLSYVSTWRQSQVDQTQFAVGADVRVRDLDGYTALQRDQLSGPGAGVPQPAVRRTAVLASPDGWAADGPPEGRPVDLLGLTPEARATLAAGRLGDEGGTTVASLQVEADEVTGVELGAATGLVATVRVGSAGRPVPGVAVILRAVLEDAAGLVQTVELGILPVDGQAQDLTATVVAGEEPTTDGLMAPLELVGLQAILFLADPEQLGAGSTGGAFQVPVVVERLAALRGAEVAPATVDVDPGLSWSTQTQGFLPTPTYQPEDGVLGLRLTGDVADLNRQPSSVTQVAWEPVGPLAAVLSRSVARGLDARPGDGLLLVVDGVTVPLDVTAVAPRVPTTTGGQDAVVVDHTLLARLLAERGAAGSAVDEWWVEVAPADAASYVAGLDRDASGAPVADRALVQVRLAEDLQEHPLRVSTSRALLLVTLAATLLAAAGFGIHAAVTVRARAGEFAVLRALGLSRPGLTVVTATETTLLGVVGGVLGIALGALLSRAVTPLVAVSGTGGPPVPSVVVEVPWADVGLLLLAVAGALAAVVLVVARAQHTTGYPGLLREGDR